MSIAISMAGFYIVQKFLSDSLAITGMDIQRKAKERKARVNLTCSIFEQYELETKHQTKPQVMLR
jgi:hypothetical protein